MWSRPCQIALGLAQISWSCLPNPGTEVFTQSWHREVVTNWDQDLDLAILMNALAKKIIWSRLDQIASWPDRSWVSGDQVIMFTQSWHRCVYPILTQGGSDKLRSRSGSRDRISSINYNEWTRDADHVIASLPDCSWVSWDQVIMFTQSWHRGVYPILTQGGSDKLRPGSGPRDRISSINYNEWTSDVDRMIASLSDCSWVSGDQVIVFTQSWQRGVYPFLTQGGSDNWDQDLDPMIVSTRSIIMSEHVM
jgi:hypothetical protein